MEQIVMGVVILIVVIWVRRNEIFKMRWQPEQNTWVAVGTGLFAFVLSACLLLLEPGSTTARWVLYGGIWVGTGVAIPWGYNLLVEKDTPAGLGLHKGKLGLSLLISFGLAAFFSLVIFFQADWAALDWIQVCRSAVVLIAAGGLFELFLYYGFIHLRLEKAFGPLPAIVLTAVFYVLWHTGTQLPLEADPWMGALKLLGVGLMYQAVFSLTYNLIIIWPLFMGVGVMIDFLVNIGELKAISSGFSWGVGSVISMGIVILVLMWIRKSGDQIACN